MVLFTEKTFAQLYILELRGLIRVLLNKRLKQMYTAISRKVIAKTVHAKIPRKVIWDMINTLVLDTVAVEPTFVAFL